MFRRIRCPTTSTSTTTSNSTVGGICSNLLLPSSLSLACTLGVGSRTAAVIRVSMPTSTPSRRRTYATTTTTTSSASKTPHSKPGKPEHLPLPPCRSPHTSAKLSALHSRLCLSPAFPIETLARCLIDPTSEPNPKFNNGTLSNLGNNLLGYYITEHLLGKYPRLPIDVLRAAMHAYVSPQALFQVGREWGVEDAFEPTLEVDAGLLQFKRVKPGEPWGPQKLLMERSLESSTPPSTTTTNNPNPNQEQKPETPDPTPTPTPSPPPNPTTEAEAGAEAGAEVEGTTQSHATANFVKSVFGAIYLHESPSSAHHFFRQHITSRLLDTSKLFNFDQPTRHLSRLCSREGFQQPIARLLSETGRRSKTPVFIVGAYSGEERLGEGYGGSLDEARIRAAVSALKGWYLYSPAVEGTVDRPSRMEQHEEDTEVRKFKSVFVDVGEVIV